MSKLLSEMERTSAQERAVPGGEDLQKFDELRESPCVSTSLDTPTSVEPDGIDIERLDASLLQALSCLFPKDHGRTFVASLLRAAVMKQIDIPEVGCVEVAVIMLKSIEAFARQHGHGKDTALRYVDILEALQMVRRSRHADCTELLLPLVAWTPSGQALAALDALLLESAARAKLQQLAGTVRSRFLLLY